MLQYLKKMADSKFATAPLRSDRLRLNMFITESGAYLTHWRYEGSPEPFTALFVVLLEQQVIMLMDVQEESPCWLRDYSRLSDNLLGIAHVLEPSVGSSFWEITLSTRGEVFVMPADLTDYEAFSAYVRQNSGQRQRDRRAFARLAFAQEHPEETVRLHDLVASREENPAYDADLESDAEQEVPLDHLPEAPASWEVSLEETPSEPSTSSVPSYRARLATEHAEDIRMHVSVASTTVDDDDLSMDGTIGEYESEMEADTDSVFHNDVSQSSGDWALDHSWGSHSTHYSPTSTAMDWSYLADPDATIDLVSDSNNTITIGSSSSSSSPSPPPPAVSPMAASSPFIFPSPASVPPSFETTSPPSPASSTNSVLMSSSFNVSGIVPLASDPEPDT